MTMGSEISINEGLNKTDMSDSDSLKSFEKHEMSTTADTESLSTSRTDDSWRASGGRLIYMSQMRENRASGFPTRFDTNRPVQSQKRAKF